MTERNETEAVLTTAVDNLLAVGRMWATHGLNIGRAALDTTAETLKVTATTLQTLAERIEAESEGDKAA